MRCHLFRLYCKSHYHQPLIFIHEIEVKSSTEGDGLSVTIYVKALPHKIHHHLLLLFYKPDRAFMSQGILEPVILLPLSVECWGFRRVP